MFLPFAVSFNVIIPPEEGRRIFYPISKDTVSPLIAFVPVSVAKNTLPRLVKVLVALCACIARGPENKAVVSHHVGALLLSRLRLRALLR